MSEKNSVILPSADQLPASVEDKLAPRSLAVPLSGVVEVGYSPHPFADIAEPYHMYFVDQSEGAETNLLAAEHNLDASLMLTWAIRDRYSRARKDKSEFPAEIQWYYDKYPASDKGRDFFNSPASVVRNWLEKLGPQNDMTGAEADFKAARSWLKDDINKSQNKSGSQMDNKNFRLIATIDLELAMLEEDPVKKRELLGEAAAYTQYTMDMNRSIPEGKKLGSAALDQIVLVNIHRELQKLRIFGTTDTLSASQASGEDRDAYTEAMQHEFGSLTRYLAGVADELIGELEYDRGEINIEDHKKSIGLLFEAVSYQHFTDAILKEPDGVFTYEITPGTMREESSTTHKIVIPGSLEYKKSDDEVNTNFDLQFLQYGRQQDGHGMVSSVYIQNKVDPDYAPDASAAEISSRFFGSKEYRYLTPQNMIKLYEQSPAKFEVNRDTLLKFVRAMRSSL